MKFFDYLFQSYKEAYKKSRYWLFLLYTLLVIQIWMILAFPGSGILSFNEKLNWSHNFYSYFISTFNPDTSKASSIEIIDFFQKQLHYKLDYIFKLPPDLNSNYYKNANNILDSLIHFDIIDSSQKSKYFNAIFEKLNKSIPYFRKLHVERDSSLIHNIGDNLTERKKLLDNNRAEFQAILDPFINSSFEQIIKPKLTDVLYKMTHNLTKDTLITLNSLGNIDFDSYKRRNEFLNKSIFKNPYIDLPLRAQTVLLLLLFITPLTYLYYSIINKYYSKLEKNVSLYNTTETIKTSSFKNALQTIKLLSISERWFEIVGIIFNAVIPYLIIVLYTRYLFREEIWMTISAVIFLIRMFIWIQTNKPNFIPIVKSFFSKNKN